MGAQHKKITYPVQDDLFKYLQKYNHCRELPVQYEDLCAFKDILPLYDKFDDDTLWM